MNILDDLSFIVNSFRADSWVNALTGFGTSRDKTTATTHVEDFRIDDVELTSLFNHNDMARKIVTIVPREMLRQGYTIEGNAAAAEKLSKRMTELSVNSLINDAMVWGRLYGGSVLYIGANDGRPPETPLREDWITSVDFVDVIDRRYVNPSCMWKNSAHPDYGSPEIYMINHLDGGTSYVHASRLIRFGGARTDDLTRIQLQSWDYSVLQSIYRILGHFDEVFQASRLMMTDASQAVFKLKGLLAAIAGGQKKDLQTRAMLLDTLRSVSRAVFLDVDAGEEFSKVPTQFAGVSDVLTQTANRLAAATEIPVTLLMGQAPAGLNATGASDIRIFYDLIRSAQENDLLPRLNRVIRLFALGLGLGDVQFTVNFRPLWQETPQEEAARALTIAQTDQVYIQNEVYTPEEVAKVRSKPKGWDQRIQIESNRDPLEPAKLAPPPPKLPPPPGE